VRSLSDTQNTNLGSVFLDPEDVRTVSLGAIRNLLEEQDCHDLDSRLQGMPIRPTCIGTKRAGTHLLLCSVLLFLSYVQSLL
jgi:hypothetical protein